MKKRITAMLAALVLAVLALTPIFAGDVPSLFINDGVWYRDKLSPLVERGGKYYIPVGLCEAFDFITVRTPKDDNILIYNRDTGRYISAVVSDGTAAVDGEIIRTDVFRDGGTYYINESLACEVLGLLSETYTASDGTTVMRVYSDTPSVSIVELAESAGSTDEDEELIYPAITQTADERKTVYVIIGSGLCDPAEGYGMDFTVMLTEDADADDILRALSHGEYGVISDGDADVLDSLNARLKEVTHKPFRAVLTDAGGWKKDALAARGYAVIEPDFIGDGNTYAPLMLEEIKEYANAHGSAVVYITDSWNGRELLRLISELDGTEYRTANIR